MAISHAAFSDCRQYSVLGAGGPFDTSLIDMIFFSPRTNLKAGQEVVTSGDGGIFPPGIPVGQIVDSRPAEFGLYTEARVKLNANLSGLEEMWVMIQ